MAMSPRLLRPIASPFVYNAEATAWEAAVIANGGTVSTSTKQAVSTFCDAIDAAGIRDRFMRLNLLCGDNLAAARTPLYRSLSPSGTQYGGTSDTNIGPFVEADFSLSTGLQCNGSTKALETGIDLPTCYAFGMENDNVHMMVCRPEALQGGNGGNVMGGYVDGDYLGLVLIQTSSDSYFYSGDFQGDHVIWSSSNTDPGMYLAQFSAASTGEFLRNDQSIKTSLYNSGPTSFSNIATDVLVFGAANGFGGLDTSIALKLTGYSFGKAFTSSAQRTAYYNAMLAFQTALGRSM